MPSNQLEKHQLYISAKNKFHFANIFSNLLFSRLEASIHPSIILMCVCLRFVAGKYSFAIWYLSLNCVVLCQLKSEIFIVDGFAGWGLVSRTLGLQCRQSLQMVMGQMLILRKGKFLCLTIAMTMMMNWWFWLIFGTYGKGRRRRGLWPKFRVSWHWLQSEPAACAGTNH